MFFLIFEEIRGFTWIWLVHRSTFICKTPGYHHLGAASNAVTRNYFSHNATIWFNNIPYFTYKKWTKHRIKKWKTASCCWENFWLFSTKIFFFDFFSALFKLFRLTNFNFKLNLHIKTHKNSEIFFDNLAVRTSDNWQLVLNQSSTDLKAVNIRKV